MSFQENLKSIQEAYEGIITEGNEPKFKVGDKVGVGSFMSSAGYQPQDTGTVSKVNKFGHHIVDFDNRKSFDNPSKPYQEQFDYAGKTRRENSGSVIIPVDQHNKAVADRESHATRAQDMRSIVQHITSKQSMGGQFPKLDIATADHLKGLIDKHTDKE
jgi:hypothetical protein